MDIALIGTDTKDYYVEMDYVVLEEIPWQTVEKVITDGSYQSGQVITTPYTGYVVETYRYKYDKETDQLISKEYVAASDYDKRDREIAVTQGADREIPVAPHKAIAVARDARENAAPFCKFDNNSHYCH